MTSSTLDAERPTGITLPAWSIAILGTVITAGAAWVSSSFFSLRDDTIRMEQRIVVVERDQRKVDDMPSSMASMQADLATIKTSLAELRDDVKRLAAPKGQR
jgi:hypothetical protein